MTKKQPRFEVVEDWPQLPAGLSFGESPDVAVDSRDRLYVFSRDPNLVSVFDPDGIYLRSWGEGLFTRPHGMVIDEKDHLFLTDADAHVVRKYTPDGELLMTLGEPHSPSDTGIVIDSTPVQRAAGPFNMPAHVAVVESGELFVTDGYGNARVHRFSAEGKLLASWGEPGAGPGQFNVPHGAAIDSRGLLYVADRENSRIQIFTQDGAFVDMWGFPNRPNNVLIDKDDLVYVSEIGFLIDKNGGPPHFRYMTEPPPGHSPYARVSVCTTGGEVLQRIGEEDVVRPGNVFVPHGLCVDSRGDLYVGELPVSAGADALYAPHKLPWLQKFRRVA